MLFNGTTTTSPALAVTATFSNAVTGPDDGNVTLPGNTGLFAGETLAAGTPTLPSLVVPYTATVISRGRCNVVAGGSAANAITVPTTGGGLLSGTVVSLPDAYLVTSANANPDSDHATMVNVSGQTASAVSTADGVTQIGTVTAGQTLFNSGGTQAVNISIQVNSYGPTSGSTSLERGDGGGGLGSGQHGLPTLPLYYKIRTSASRRWAAPIPATPTTSFSVLPLSGTFASAGRN